MTTLVTDHSATTAGALPDRSVVPAVWARYTDLVIDHGEGSWLVTTDGERYLDYTSGIGVDQHRPCASRGERRGRRAGRPSCSTASRTSSTTSRASELHAELARRAPAPGWGAFLCNSGAEAVEAAVKLARVASGRPAIVAFREASTAAPRMGMALTSSRVTIRGDFEPLPSSVYHAPYPDSYRGGGGPESSRRHVGAGHGRAVRAARGPASRSRPSSSSPSSARAATSCRPAWFLPRLRRAIATSTASCSSRTRSRPGSGGPGRFWAMEHWAVAPDIGHHGQGHRVRAAAGGNPGAAWRRSPRWAPGAHGGHLRRQRGRVCRGTRDARGDRRAKGSSRTPLPVARSSSTGSGASALATPAWATCAAWAPWSRSSSWTHGCRSPQARSGPRQAHPCRGPGTTADPALSGFVEPGRALHPAPGHDAGRGRPGGRHHRRGVGRRRRLRSQALDSPAPEVAGPRPAGGRGRQRAAGSTAPRGASRTRRCRCAPGRPCAT